MLIIGRKVGERIFIDGGRIVITITETTPHKVRLGITAPPEVSIDREEIFDKKQFSAGIPKDDTAR